MGDFQHSCRYVNDSRWVHGRGQSVNDKWLTQWRPNYWDGHLLQPASWVGQAVMKMRKERKRAPVWRRSAIDTLMHYFGQGQLIVAYTAHTCTVYGINVCPLVSQASFTPVKSPPSPLVTIMYWTKCGKITRFYWTIEQSHSKTLSMLLSSLVVYHKI